MDTDIPDRADHRAPRPARPRRWLGRWWPLVLTLVLAPFVALAVWAALVVVAFSGGVDELFRGDPPREDDPEVVAARQQASVDLAADTDAVADGTALPALPAGAARLGGGEVHPECWEGQHNWKIDDDYDLICHLERIEVFTVPQRDGFRADMVALDDELRAAGWTSTHSPMDSVLDDYGDDLAASSSREPGTGPTARSGHSMDDLPQARYTRTSGAWSYGLVVGWAERGSPGHTITYRDERADLRDADGRAVHTGDLLRAVPQQGYAVVLTESVEYFHR